MTETDAKLVAYADGELDEDGIREVEALIAADPRAWRTVQMHWQTAGALRAACLERFYAGDAVRVGAVSRATRPRPGRRVALAVASALAASVAGFVGGLGWARWPADAREALVEEVAEYHAVYAREENPLDLVPAKRADEIAAWLGKQLGRSLVVPDLSAEGLHFAGARLVVVNATPVAQLVYTRAQGLPVGVCVSPLRGHEPLVTEAHDEQETVSWQDGTSTYVVVGEMNGDALRAIADRVARQLNVGRG